MATYKPGKPPGPNAGRISPNTVAIRPKSGMTEEQEKRARQMCRNGDFAADIARAFGVTVEQAELVMANVRTPHLSPARATLNTTVAEKRYVNREALPGEPAWQTVARLFEELEELRAGRTPLRK